MFFCLFKSRLSKQVCRASFTFSENLVLTWSSTLKQASLQTLLYSLFPNVHLSSMLNACQSFPHNWNYIQCLPAQVNSYITLYFRYHGKSPYWDFIKFYQYFCNIPCKFFSFHFFCVNVWKKHPRMKV